MISFNDFQKLELKVAKIARVEKIEGSDKLLKLEVELDKETRIIVAGIAKDYKVKELLNKLIVIVANLEPKDIRGIKSEGMVLGAESEGGYFLLNVDEKVQSGSKIL